MIQAKRKTTKYPLFFVNIVNIISNWKCRKCTNTNGIHHYFVDFFQAFSGHSQSFSQLRVVFSFYASTIVSALDAVDKVSDTIISKLLPYVQQVQIDSH